MNFHINTWDMINLKNKDTKQQTQLLYELWLNVHIASTESDSSLTHSTRTLFLDNDSNAFC